MQSSTRSRPELSSSPGPATAAPGPSTVVRVAAAGRRLGHLFLIGALLTLVVALSVAVLPRLVGYQTFVVQGGSMGDALPAGSIALTRQVPARAIAAGDIIVARGLEAGRRQPTIHRVVAINDVDGQRIAQTRGDANNAADTEPLVLPQEVIRVAYSVPWVGYLVALLGTPWGWGLLFVLPVFVLCLAMLDAIWIAPSAGKRTTAAPKRALATTQPSVARERRQVTGGKRGWRPHGQALLYLPRKVWNLLSRKDSLHKEGGVSNMAAIEGMRQEKEALKQELEELRSALATLEEAGFKGAGVQLLEARLQEVEREFNRLADEILVRSLLLAGETALGPIVTAAIAEEGAKEFFSDTNITFRVTFDGSGGEPTIKGELELVNRTTKVARKGGKRQRANGDGRGTVLVKEG